MAKRLIIDCTILNMYQKLPFASFSAKAGNDRTGLSYPVAAVAVSVFKDASASEVLLVKRSQDPKKGFWSIPGGAVELGETIVDSATREIAEETGLKIEVDEHSFFTSTEYISANDDFNNSNCGRKKVGFHYVISQAYAFAPPNSSLVAGDDAELVSWFNTKDICNKGIDNLTSNVQSVIRKARQKALKDRQLENEI